MLVEVHTEPELEIALQSGATLIGVNNRDLKTFHHLETTFRLLPRMPDGVLKVSESGIESADHVRALWQAGVNALLVGEGLMRASNRKQRFANGCRHVAPVDLDSHQRCA